MPAPPPAAAEPESQPASLATTEEVDFGDSGGGFDEEVASPEPVVAPSTPPPAASASATTPATPAQRTPNSVQSIIQSIQGTPASIQSTPVQERVESPHADAEPMVQEEAQEPTPMARLPSARLSKQVAKKRAEVEQTLMRPPAPNPDDSYEIDIITGASSLDGLSYRVMWKGWALTDWWEALDASGSFDDPEYQGRLVHVLPQGTGPKVSAGMAPPKGKCLVLVLGKHLDSKREAFEADGTLHELDMTRCVLDGKPPSDWLLQLDDEILDGCCDGRCTGGDRLCPRQDEVCMGWKRVSFD